MKKLTFMVASHTIEGKNNQMLSIKKPIQLKSHEY